MSVLHADVVFIGNELCGLAAAALLAHERHKVVVIDDEEEEDLRELGGVLLPVAPSLWCLPKKGPAVEIIDALGLRQDAKRLLQTPVGIGVVDDEDLRLQLFLEETLREKELQRAFGEEGAQAAYEAFEALSYNVTVQYLAEATRLHEDGFFARRKEKKRLEDLLEKQSLDPASIEVEKFQNHLSQKGLAAAFGYLGPFLQNHAEPKTKGVAGLLALARFHRGTLGDCDAGLGPRIALRRLFKKVIEGHGGVVLTSTKVTEMRVSGKRVTHIAAGGNEYATQGVIDASTNRALPERLPESRVATKEKALREALSSEKNAAVVRWVLPKEAVAEGAGTRLLLLPQDENDIAVVVSLYAAPPKKTNRESQKSEREAGWVGIVAAARGEEGQSDALADKIEARLQKIFPFAKEKALARDRLTGEDAAKALPAFRAKGGEAHVLGGRRPRGALSNWGRAGRDLVPFFGLGGELAAARSVSALAEEWLKK